MPQDGENARQNKLVRIVVRMSKVLKRVRYPHRQSKYANHIYDDHQHVILLALHQHLRKPYRDACNILEACDSILEALGLTRVPHWTTLQKFSARADIKRLEMLFIACLDEARLRILHLAVDSTGFSPTSASFYYTRIIELRTGERGRPRNRRSIRRYLKQTMAVETRKQLIAAVKFRYGPGNDSPDFIPVLRKFASARQTVKLVVADKGYDAERNHEFARESFGARTVIPVRGLNRPGIRIRGRYRRKQLKDFDIESYHQRAKVETVHSVEKRKMGDHVLAKSAGRQHRELILRAFAYNVARLEAIFLSFIEGFYKASVSLDLRMALVQNSLLIIFRREIELKYRYREMVGYEYRLDAG